MSQPYVGQIILVGFNFAPQGFLTCDGSLQPISDFETLFQLIGTTYGGDGQSTFAVPDLRGRIPIHQGNSHVIGEAGGSENITLSASQIPAHTHVVDASTVKGAIACTAAKANTRSPVNAVPAMEATGVTLPYSSAAPDTAMGASITATAPSGATGGSQAHTNLQPYLVMNYCIAWAGIFPTQA